VRPPDLTIGNPPQTLRWHLLRWRGWQVALHCWLKSDDDRALHDHVADNVSIILNRGYWEIIGVGDKKVWHLRRPWLPYFRKAETPHRVVLRDPNGMRPVWSLWLRGPPRRTWGFHCPKGWRPWRQYVAERDYHAPGSTSTVGRGCD
jgi:hypothetical protein